MFEKIIAYSLKNKLIVLLLILGLIAGGIYAMFRLSVDAVPDITNNQVQVVTSAPTLAAEEVEQFITFPIEMAVRNIPDVVEVRSISRYGLSVVTIVFDDALPIMAARQHISEQLNIVKEEIPAEFGTPEMMPITTGLGEIYQYVLQVEEGYESKFDLMEIRTIQDWIVKRQLAGLKGIVEVSSFGGNVKQYEVSAKPELMQAFDITLKDVEDALVTNNSNSGGSYIETRSNAFYLRTEGRANGMSDIEQILVKGGEFPVRIKDIAEVRLGTPKRYGAMTMDGKGETVGGITLMLKGANSSDAVENVKNRMQEIQASLPEGLRIYPYLDRSELVAKTIDTVTKNLIEGGLIVIFVLVIFLGNLRAGLIVSSVIPLSMLFAFILMHLLGVSANLMSLGAIDFGIVVDGAVIIVEGVLHILHHKHKGKTLSKDEMNVEIKSATGKIYRSAAFGVLIILVVFVPIFTLEGIEGKTFLPMAQTVSFAIIGSLFLSLTYVPVASALFLKRTIREKPTISDRMVGFLQHSYQPVLNRFIANSGKVILIAVASFFGSILLFTTMGSEFIPTLEEGDLAVQMTVSPGSSLKKSIASSTEAERILLEKFPEVKHVVSKIGTAEVPTDPMAIEDADIMIVMKPKEEWVSASSREALIKQMKNALAGVPEASFEFSQPIQLRFNELMTGAKTDIAIQIFGEETAVLKELADRTASRIKQVTGVGDVKVEQTEGLKQLSIHADKNAMALHQVNVDDVNHAIRAAYAGSVSGSIYENERRFDLVVRLHPDQINELSLHRLFVRNARGELIPLTQVASINEATAPMQISRENAQRRITIGVNVRDRDVASLVQELQSEISAGVKLPPGYTIKYGGQFENLQHAMARLKIAVPVALALILLLLYFAFGKVKESLIIFMTVPMASIGGILALWLRDMPFSISAGIGFIALFGVAVLNGIVLVNEFVRFKSDDRGLNFQTRIIKASTTRLRPVLMTALVASLGFLPMALATSNGAEVQRPLATVVIGGLVTSTLLTLFVLPALYFFIENRKMMNVNHKTLPLLLIPCLLFIPRNVFSQDDARGLQDLIQTARQNRIEVKLNTLEKQIWETERKNVFRLDPFNVQLQYGQNDGKAMDTYVQFSQDLGNPWGIKHNRNYADLGIAYHELKAKTLEAEITYAVSSMYYNYLSDLRAYELIKLISGTLNQLEETTKLRMQAGEISTTEYLLIRQLAQSIALKNQEILIELTSSQRELSRLCGEEIVVRDTVLLALPYRVGEELSPSLYSEFNLKAKQLAYKEKVIKTSYAPTIQLGYFHQTLDQVRGYQGLLGGMSIPLIYTGRKNELARNKIEQERNAVEQSYSQNQLYSEFIALKEQLRLTQEAFTFDPAFSENTILGIAGLRSQLDSGEINMLDFIRFSDILIEGALSELSLLSNYNQTILRYNFITTKF